MDAFQVACASFLRKVHLITVLSVEFLQHRLDRQLFVRLSGQLLQVNASRLELLGELDL